ncbi:MAG: hypothetical protein ACJAVT_001393 [Yoonia sp.]|jgi:hypothetical protein
MSAPFTLQAFAATAMKVSDRKTVPPRALQTQNAHQKSGRFNTIQRVM